MTIVSEDEFRAYLAERPAAWSNGYKEGFAVHYDAQPATRAIAIENHNLAPWQYMIEKDKP